MGIGQLDFEGRDKVQVAILRLQHFEPPGGYFLAFSGGKDSVVLHDLAERAGVRFEAHYNITGIDPPELVYFIREHYPYIAWEKPLENIWHLVERKGLPNRKARFCCEYLKEHTGAGRVVATGIRWQESARRKRRPMVESCRYGKAKSYVHPIIDWTSAEVWEYIRGEGLPYCHLYDEGYSRLGCILCPMTTARQTARDRLRWPKVAAAWFRACQRYYQRGTEGTQRWASAEEMFEWWLSRKAAGGPSDECGPAMFT